MTKVMPQKGPSLEYTGAKAQAGAMPADLWQAMVVAGNQPAPNPSLPNSLETQQLSGEAPQIPGTHIPPVKIQAELVQTAASARSPVRVGGTDACADGIPAARMTDEPEAVHTMRPLDAGMQGLHGFVYLQRLIAQGYLSELDSVNLSFDSARPMASPAPGVARGKQDISVSDADMHRCPTSPSQRSTSAITPNPPGTVHEPMASPMERVGEEGGEEAEPARAEPLPNFLDATAEWLRRNCLVLEQRGHLHVWVRDYHLQEGEKAHLIEQLRQDAHANGRRVASIALNGTLLWQRGVD